MKKIKIDKIEYLIKHNGFFQGAYKSVMSITFKLFGLFVPVDNDMILFSGHGRHFNDSPRAIYEAMKVDIRLANMKFVWAVDNPKELCNENCIVVKEYSLKYFFYALKAKYWVACVGIEHGLKFKKKKTIYLNTLHGIPIKLCGNAAPGRNDFDFSKTNFVCCSSEYDGAIFIHDYNVKKESLLRVGLPRNDTLHRFNENEVHSWKEKLNISEDKKVILYVPTWRDKASLNDDFSIAPPLNMENLKEKLGKKYVFLFRMHPFTVKSMGIKFDEVVRDVSQYPDINDLYKVADVLITDYSSAIFDYAIVGKAAFCFAYDYEDYVNERGLYLDLEKEMPNGIIKSDCELISKIENIEWEKQKKILENFKNKYSCYGGSATEKCIEALLGERLS